MTLERKQSPTDKLYRRKQWKFVTQIVLARENSICEYCHKPIVDTFNIHHKEVATVDNFYDLNNLMLLHIECHTILTHHEKVKRDESQIYTATLTQRTNLVDFNS